ncbi:hypothetical protein Tco_0990158 [Tanacetum coccineum]|uniref:Uncharacterized protein n=1 Tax=Tanacetum coccineum TaxID=301880 RepID=A0ABQ5EWC4_9ASTR
MQTWWPREVMEVLGCLLGDMVVRYNQLMNLRYTQGELMQDVAIDQHVNTKPVNEVITGRFKLNIVDPSVNTASSYDSDSPKDMFKIRASHTLKATHVEFFSDEDEPEVDLGNITNSYIVPPTPNTRIHKDHPITNVIGDVKSSIQTRRMTKFCIHPIWVAAE